MASRRRLWLTGMVTLLVGLVSVFPARVAYRWLGPPEVAIAGISGSIWSGSAARANAGGIYFSNIEWSLRPFSLLTGKIAYHISAKPGSGNLEATVAFGLGSTVTIEDLQSVLSLQDLQSLLSLQTFAQVANIFGLRGDASLRIERVVVDAGVLTHALGKIEVAGLELPQVAAGSIGDYKAEFVAQDNGIVASVEDTDGIVDLAGSFTISADGSYQFLGEVAPKAATPERLRRQLQFLGSPNERGQHQLRLEGQL